MVGKGRHRVLAVRSMDPVLAVAGAVGLAGSVGTALVVDFERTGSMDGGRTMRDLLVDGPTLDELSPGRPGVALIPAGDVAPDDVVPLIQRLSERWPAITLRVGRRVEPFPTVPVLPIYPGRLIAIEESHGVWQPVSRAVGAPGPGPVLPRLRPAVLSRLLSGQMPRRSRWVAAWRPVWEMPWA